MIAPDSERALEWLINAYKRRLSDPGSSWVGWMNNGSAAGRVELVFAFHSPREFTGLTMHLARPARSINAPGADGIDELKSCQVNFALEKENYIGKSVRFSAPQSAERPTFYNVTVDLKKRVGRYLQVQLEFTGQWLLMSEVTFHSRKSSLSKRKKRTELTMIERLRRTVGRQHHRLV